jgi:hypothetical protein
MAFNDIVSIYRIECKYKLPHLIDNESDNKSYDDTKHMLWNNTVVITDIAHQNNLIITVLYKTIFIYII